MKEQRRDPTWEPSTHYDANKHKLHCVQQSKGQGRQKRNISIVVVIEARHGVRPFRDMDTEFGAFQV
jgi:hypothetical protein